MEIFPNFTASITDTQGPRTLIFTDLDPGKLFYHLRPDAPNIQMVALDPRGNKLAIDLAQGFMINQSIHFDEAVVQLNGIPRIEVDLTSARIIDTTEQAIVGAVQAHTNGTCFVIGNDNGNGETTKLLIDIATHQMAGRRHRGVQFTRWSLHLDDGDRTTFLMKIDVTPK